MKKNLTTLLLALLTWMGANAMDYETARERAYYLTDKMAYELNLNDQQYNDAYEINLDYLLSLNTEADLADVRYLTYRNEDLRHILYDWQWTTFAAVDYLFRPVLWLSGGWYFPVFRHYAHGYYFYHRPAIFWDYRGGHGRFHFAGGFYLNRRPVWHGGLRGMDHHMVGHPNGSRGGRYGEPGGGRGGFRPEGRGGRSGQGYHFDGNRLSDRNRSMGDTRSTRNGGTPATGTRPDADRGGRNSSGNLRPDAGRTSGSGMNSSSRTTVTQPRTTVTQPRTSGSRSAGTVTPSRATVTNPTRSGSSFSGGSRSGSSFSGSSRSSSSFSGSRSAGSSSFGGSRSATGGASRGSAGGMRSGGSSRGGGRR